MWLLLLCFLKAPIVCTGLISWVKSGEHQKASDNRCWLTRSRSYYFPFSERVLIFPLSPLVFLSPSIHPACVGGIKVALLSSKLQISFASVHLALCFITAARGGRRFRSGLHKVMTPTGCYSPLSLTPPLLYSLARGDYFCGVALIGQRSEDWQWSEQLEDVTRVSRAAIKMTKL